MFLVPGSRGEEGKSKRRLKADIVSSHNPHKLCDMTLLENEKLEILIPIVTGKQLKGLAGCTTLRTIVLLRSIAKTARYMKHRLSVSSAVIANFRSSHKFDANSPGKYYSACPFIVFYLRLILP
jgi:hypothetical protein